MYDFIERKFLSLPIQRQHKKCAELLNALYEKMLQKLTVETEWNEYNQLCLWMQKDQLEKINPKIISDRYHQHLQHAHVAKKEHRLLPEVRKGDRPEAAEPCTIAIYLDNLRSAHNVGSILRTVEALALGTVYFSPGTP
jgi:tRNA G18 (ribose-2'-O)-methylase SpoU